MATELVCFIRSTTKNVEKTSQSIGWDYDSGMKYSRKYKFGNLVFLYTKTLKM
jgi:hypothetical protein